MAILFKTKGEEANPLSEQTLKALQEEVRTSLGLGSSADIAIGVFRCSVNYNGIQITLPFGLAQVKNGSQRLQEARQALTQVFEGIAPQKNTPAYSAASEAPGGVPTPAKPVAALELSELPITADADMEDQLWVEHVATQLFPGVVALGQADDLYQPVMGTAPSSVYKTCFIGPKLRVAARIKGTKISFRACTTDSTPPDAPVREVLARLGMTSVHASHISGHTLMSGNFDNKHAHEYRAVFGAFYAALKPWITSDFPAIGLLAQGVR